MSEAKHTPGPWQYLPESPEDCASIVAKTAFVCEFFCGPAEANARLIAAAPDLLDALHLVRDYIATMKVNGHEYSMSIDAAIAKATKVQT